MSNESVTTKTVILGIQSQEFNFKKMNLGVAEVLGLQSIDFKYLNGTGVGALIRFDVSHVKTEVIELDPIRSLVELLVKHGITNITRLK